MSPQNTQKVVKYQYEQNTICTLGSDVRVLKKGKAAGCDRMSPELIKLGGPSMTAQIHKICTYLLVLVALVTTSFPISSEWAKAT